MKNNKFCFIVAAYNAQEYIAKCIESMKMQTYTNWTCAITDDCSTDFTHDIILENTQCDKRFMVFRHPYRSYALASQLTGVYNVCTNDEDIIIILDGDDWLYDKHVLSYLNSVYEDNNTWATYGQYITPAGDVGGCRDDWRLFQRAQYEQRYISHLRSYKYWLFKKIDQEDLKTSTGDFFKACADMSVFYPICEMAGQHLKFIPRILYVYNNTSPINLFKINTQDQINNNFFLHTKCIYPIIKNKDHQFQKLNVGLFDKNFSHSLYAGLNENESSYIHWIRNDATQDVTIFTDRCLDEADNTKCKIKVAWLLESRAVFPEMYLKIQTDYHKFDYVLTHDKQTLDKVPNSIFISSGRTWIKYKDIAIYEKTNNVCFISSGNDLNLPGHALRKQVIELCSKKIDKVCGRNIKQFDSKVDAIRDFRYCIIIQNAAYDFYFTEHIIDCFLTGTIPIFWGCKSTSKFFNDKGIIHFSSIEQLRTILCNISADDYANRLSAVKDNFYKAHQFKSLEDQIYINFLRYIEAGSFII